MPFVGFFAEAGICFPELYVTVPTAG